MPGRVFNVRPGLISGPHDPTDRFTYWPRRISAGGEVLAPDSPERRVQFIDVRDLAGWIIEMSAEQRAGTYNATGPDYTLRWDDCSRSARPSGRRCGDRLGLRGVPGRAGVEPFTEMPLWVPREYAGLQAVDCGRAIEAGLAFRPLSETIRDVLEWDRARAEEEPAAGLRPERERELLSAWHGGTL